MVIIKPEEISQLVSRYGETTQRLKACEEFAELIQVVAQTASGIRTVDRDHYKEEVADAYNMLAQLCAIEGFSEHEISAIARAKINRALSNS